MVDCGRVEAEGDVFGDGGFAEEDALRNKADFLLPAGQIGRAERAAIQQQFAGIGIDEPEQQINGGGFAGTGFTNQTNGFAGRNGEGDAVECRSGLAGVGEANVLQADF